MNAAGTITVDIRETIALDQAVFDSTRKKVGTVDDVDLATGWLTVSIKALGEEALYVPFRLITYLDPNELFLGTTKDELHRDYASPPPRSTSVEGEGSEQVATTTQESGYDGAPVVVQRMRLDDVRDKISTDYKVFTSDMVDLGHIREYDAATGLMILDKGVFSRHDVVVPIAVVDQLDAELGHIILIASNADVQRMAAASLVRTAAELSESN